MFLHSLLQHKKMTFLSNKSIHSKSTFHGYHRTYFFLLLFLPLSFASCKHTFPIVRTSNYSVLKSTDSLTITVGSTNLSEDMSALSTNNDEILLLILDSLDNQTVTTPLLSFYTTLSKTKIKDSCSIQTTLLANNQKHILFLLEIDTNKSKEDIAKLIQQHYQLLRDAYLSKDYQQTEQLIGDDDILGIHPFNFPLTNSVLQINFNDIHRMDRYQYTIKIH